MRGAQYTIRVKNRDIFREKLKKGIPSAIYYPVPLHLQECFKYLNYKNGNLQLLNKHARSDAYQWNNRLTLKLIIIICVKERLINLNNYSKLLLIIKILDILSKTIQQN